MVRGGLVVALLLLLWPAQALGQRTSITYMGFATASIGAAHGGDAADAGWAPGVSLAVLDSSGLGAELDLSHVGEFDAANFRESGITTLTLNAIGVWSDPTALVRPYVVGGLGVLRVRACVLDCRLVTSRTDLAFDVGAGAFIIFQELVGLRGELRYFRFLQRHPDLPLTNGGFFDFWRTSVGVTVQWPIR